MKYNKGFAPLVVLLIVLGVLAVGGVVYFAGKSSTPKNEVSDNYFPTTEQNYTPPTTNNNPPQQQTPPPVNNPPPSTSTACNSNSPSTIKVLSPNGGEVYQAGQQIVVKWKSCNVTPNSIGIILIKHNPSVAYTQSEGQGDYAGFSLGSYSTADDGVEQITLPASSNTYLISGQHYFISVIGLGDATHIGSGYSPGDYSDGLFTITSPQSSSNNVTDQPAYLIKAYSQNSKNYIDVDYIEVLSGTASLQAQVADGKCPNVNDCYDFPNGYKRNQNPLVRTFEVSNNAPITIGGLLFSKKFDVAYAANNNGSNYYTSGDYYNDYVGNQSNHNSTFVEFKNLVSLVTSYLPYNPPFKKPITYIRIDVQNNVTTKIVEPYQE